MAFAVIIKFFRAKKILFWNFLKNISKDCCDGSDEYDGKVKCENKCIELAAKMREEEEKLRLLRDQGFLKRKELIELGNEFKKTIQVNTN